MVSVEEAKASVQARKQELVEKRTQAEQARQTLQAQARKLPETTQRRLRQGLFAGLQGRQRARQIGSIRERIRRGQSSIAGYEQELGRYEQEQLVPAEQQIATIERQQGAYGVLRREIKKTLEEYGGQFTSAKSITKVREAFANAGLNPDYGQQLYESGATLEGKQSLWTEDREFLGTYNIGTGAVSPAKDYDFSGFELGQFVFTKKDVGGQSLLRDLPRQDILEVRDLPKTFPTVTGFGLVSAQSELPYTPARQEDLQFRTTGSPIQVQSVLDSDSKSSLFFGYGLSKPKVEYVRPLNISLVSGRPVEGSISSLPSTPQVYAGDISQVSRPSLGGGVRFVGEKTPFIKDIIRSKDIVDIKAGGVQEIFKQLDNPNLSQQDLNRLKERFEKLGGSVEQRTDETTGETTYDFYEPSVTIGSTKETRRQVPVSQLSGQGVFRYGSGLFSSEVGQYYKVIGKDIGLKETGLLSYTRPSINASIYTPQFGSVQTDPFTGQAISGYSQIEIPAKTYKIGTPTQLQKGVEFYSTATLFPTTYLGGGAEALGLKGEFGGAKGGIEYIKKYPLETGIMGGAGILYAGLRGYRWAKTPQLEFKPLSPKGFTEESLYLVGKPYEGYRYTNPLTGKLVYQEKYDVLGFGKKVVQEGRKTIVKSRTQSLIDWGQKPIYEGVYRTDKEGYKKAIEKLKDLGYTEKQAKSILRLQRPQVVEEYFTGSPLSGPKPAQATTIIPEEGKMKVLLKGEEKILPSKGETEGIKWFGKQPKIKYLSATGEEEGKLLRVFSEQETAFLKEGKYPFTKLSQRGKTTETFESLVGARKLEEFPQAKLYQQVNIGKKTLPVSRQPLGGTSKVLVAKGSPDFMVSDESILPARGFRGGTRKSSQQFLQQMYAAPDKTQKTIAGTILGAKKPTPTKIPTEEILIEPTPTPKIKSLWAGTGQYERTEGEVSSINIPPAFKTPQLERVYTPLRVEQKGKYKLDIKSDVDLRERLKGTSLESVKPLQPLKEKVISRLREILKTKTRQQQAQVQQQGFRRRFVSTPKQPLKETFRITPPPPKINLLKSSDKKISKGLYQKLFETFGRRRGKDILLGKFQTEKEASERLRAFLRGTLGRSGFVTKKGKPVKLDLGFKYRPSKKNPFRVVQKRRYSLGTLMERKEIQRARKWLK